MKTPAQLIGNIPEGDFTFLQVPLSLPDALGVEAAVDAQAQFDQEGQVTLARCDRRTLEFEDVPRRQPAPQPAERQRSRSGAAQQYNIRLARQVADRHAGLEFIIPFQVRPEQPGKKRMPLELRFGHAGSIVGWQTRHN